MRFFRRRESAAVDGENQPEIGGRTVLALIYGEPRPNLVRAPAEAFEGQLPFASSSGILPRWIPWPAGILVGLMLSAIPASGILNTDIVVGQSRINIEGFQSYVAVIFFFAGFAAGYWGSKFGVEQGDKVYIVDGAFQPIPARLDRYDEWGEEFHRRKAAAMGVKDDDEEDAGEAPSNDYARIWSPHWIRKMENMDDAREFQSDPEPLTGDKKLSFAIYVIIILASLIGIIVGPSFIAPADPIAPTPTP